MSMKAKLAGGSLLCLSFFPACELHKGNMYTAAFRIAFPFTEISETHRFLWRNSTLRVFHEEAGIETFLLSLPWLERARHTHILFLSLSKFFFYSVWPMQRISTSATLPSLAPSLRTTPRGLALPLVFSIFFSPLKTGLAWKCNSRCSFRSAKDC